jgi:ribosome-associated protein
LERKVSIGEKLTSLGTAKKIASFAFDKKAEHIVLLNMSGVVNFCDYFVICSGTSPRHVKAIADGIEDDLQVLGIKVKYKQGLEGVTKARYFTFGGASASVPDDFVGHWALLDMGDVVTHIFEGESREFYGLEHLWQEAKKIDWQK